MAFPTVTVRGMHTRLPVFDCLKEMVSLFQSVKAGPDCPEIDGDFCHQIAGKPAGSSLPPAGLVHENSHSNTTFTA